MINFSASQGNIPSEVTQKFIQAVQNWPPTSQSILSLSHTHDSFKGMKSQLYCLLRENLAIPESHEILILPAGARYQFVQCALFAKQYTHQLNFLITGYWSNLAFEVSKHWIGVNQYDLSTIQDMDVSSPIYYTSNETIDGIELLNSVKGHHLICDMTSNIMTYQIDYSNHDIIFASTQKNLGIAGSSLVIIRKNLLKNEPERLILDFNDAYNKNSSHVTPNIINFYILLEMMKWYQKQGGLSYFENKSARLSSKIYQLIDKSSLYENSVPCALRSRINIPVSLKNNQLDHFLKIAHDHGIIGIKGHPHAGGLRISLYNSITDKDVDELAQFLLHYEKTHG